jgi:predicted nucleotidyltransferase
MSGNVQSILADPEQARGGASDVDTPTCDLRPLETLLSRIEQKYHPTQIWLFGSRARGETGPWSDWDLFVVVPDETDDVDLDLRVAWRLQRGSGVHADVVPCRVTDFRNARDTVNTLSYVVAHEGVIIRGH